MNSVYLATITNKESGAVIFQFVSPDEPRANYLAGCCMDELHDYHGIAFDYSVAPVPYFPAMGVDRDLIRLALESAV